MWSGLWLPGEDAPERWEHPSAACSPSGACTGFITTACKQCSREAEALIKTHSGSSGCKQRRLGWVASPFPGREAARDNDRQVELVVVLFCPPASRALPVFPITRVKGGGRWVPFDHCLQIQLLHAQACKSSLPPSSHVL